LVSGSEAMFDFSVSSYIEEWYNYTPLRYSGVPPLFDYLPEII
jgi:hypothetical protein